MVGRAGRGSANFIQGGIRLKKKYLAGLLCLLLAASLLPGCDGQPETFVVSGSVTSEGTGLAGVFVRKV